jgi:hexokinase
MKKNIFDLTVDQLKEIALNLQGKIEEGLGKDGTEIKCLPTYICKTSDIVNGKALVLDLGGTNYRTAVVDFNDGKPTIHPENGFTKDLCVMKTKGYKKESLFKELTDPIREMKLEKGLPVGFCFSYPSKSKLNKDAILINWTKDVNIEEMVGQPVGEELLSYLNTHTDANFSSIKVINDTVASLFAGLSFKKYDANIGLIVGTGTNMAALMLPDKITKDKNGYTDNKPIPVNLESGNFNPPHLTVIDDIVDACSGTQGEQRFEKAVSGMYLGKILKSVFPSDEVEEKFDAQKLTNIINYPDIHKNRYVQVANWIYIRSAQLIAASLVGLIMVLISHDRSVKTICITAEGSLFWSKIRKGKDYNELVKGCLNELLASFGYNDIEVDITRLDNANLIGSAYAALF